MRQENQPNPPPPPPEHKKDACESAGERFRKLQPPTFDGRVDPVQAEQWIRTTERTLAYAKVPDADMHLIWLPPMSSRALDAEQAEKDVLNEEKNRRERLAREMQRSFKPSFQGNRGGQTQVQHPQDMKRKGAPTQQTRPDQGKRPKTDKWTTTTTIPPCPSCGKNHSGECRK
ncbi:hypothetical protein PanWU01x14_365660, partial [Parasponia andersonii]